MTSPVSPAQPLAPMLPCPFDGSEAEPHGRPGGGRCTECGVWNDDWNTRAALPASPVPQPAPATAMPECVKRLVEAFDNRCPLDNCKSCQAFTEPVRSYYAPACAGKEGK